MFTTALEPGELITSVSFPIPAKAAYEKFREPRVALRDGRRVRRQRAEGRARRGDRRRAGRRVPSRGVREGAGAPTGRPPRSNGIATPADGLNSDIHGSADYRAHLVDVMAKRAVAAAG